MFEYPGGNVESRVSIPIVPGMAGTTPGAGWQIAPLRGRDVLDLKRLYLRLHRYNAGLDARFALSPAWETLLDADLRQALRGERRLALLARDGHDRSIGFALASLRDEGPRWQQRAWVEIEALYVERAWRGSELAASLLASLLAWSQAAGQTTVQLYVTGSNARAIRFYERQGFRSTQLVMRRELS